MATKQTSFIDSALNVRAKGLLNSKRWSLVLGAGINHGVMPDWDTLTFRLMRSTHSQEFTKAKYDKLKEEFGWSLDGWIQSCLNKFLSGEKTIEDFIDMLTDLIYADLYGLFRAKGIKESILDKLLNNASGLKKKELELVEAFLNEHGENITAVVLAEVLLKCRRFKDRQPISILNFNADTFFEGVYRTLERLRHKKNPREMGPTRRLRPDDMFD